MRRGLTGIVVVLALGAGMLAVPGAALAALTVTLQGPTAADDGETLTYWAGVESSTRRPGDPPTPYTYAWSIDGVSVVRPADVLQPAMLTTRFTASGSHTVAVTVDDGFGNAGTATATVDVAPPKPVAVKPPDILFAGGTARLGRTTLPVTLRCTVAGGCSGTLEVRTFALKGDGWRVGSAHFSVEGTGTVRVPVSARNRKRLRRHRTTPLILRAVRDGARGTWAQGGVDVVR